MAFWHPSFRLVAVVWVLASTIAGAVAQEPLDSARSAALDRHGDDYVIGPRDVLLITSFDQPDLTGKFTVEVDGTFTYPLIDRVRAGGHTLRELEAELERRLTADGFFLHPELSAAVATYKSQQVFVVGEVRQPGTYPLSGNMSLIEALALAGSTLDTASGEIVIASAGMRASWESSPPTEQPASGIRRVHLRDLEKGNDWPPTSLRDGDTIFVLRARNVFVFGQVKNPGAYPLQRESMVLQALALAGGVTDRGSTSRIKVVRVNDGKKEERRVSLTDIVYPGDTLVVPQRFF